MNKMKFLTVGIVILLLLNAATLFILFHTHLNQLHDHHNGEDPAHYITTQLKFDANQQKQFEDLRNRHHEQTMKFHDEDRELHDLYFNLLKTDHPDKAKVDSVASLIGAQRKNLELLTFEHFQQLRTICRDDQKKLFDNTIDEIARTMAEHAPPH